MKQYRFFPAGEIEPIDLTAILIAMELGFSEEKYNLLPDRTKKHFKLKSELTQVEDNQRK